MIKKYIKKPVEIEAITKQGYIQLEGIMIAGFGDYIIKNQGKYYPCRPNTFQQTYEEVR